VINKNQHPISFLAQPLHGEISLGSLLLFVRFDAYCWNAINFI